MNKQLTNPVLFCSINKMMFSNFRFLLVCVLIIPFLFSACNQATPKQAQFIAGKTMGTTYSIKYFTNENATPITQQSIDSLLQAFNQSVSTYIPTSTISKFNKTDSIFKADNFLLDTYYQSVVVSDMTKGAFDATVMPLVNYWGFGYEKATTTATDSLAIDSIKQFIGYKLIESKGNKLIKKNPHTQLDLSAIAKGYGVDLVANFIKQKRITDFMVEIGGEVRTSGKKPNDANWILGIDKPIEDLAERELQAKIILDNQSMATSGNYRNFKVIDGKKVAHTINPTTGFSEFNSLLSVSVVTDFCSKADAYATAFMVMGLEKTEAFLMSNSNLNLEVYLIYADSNNELKTWQTSGIKLID